MPETCTSAPGPARFGVFEVDFAAGELRKSGAKIKLEGQPIQILQLLVERAGQIVTREEIIHRLWRDETFVDYEHSINAAIKRLRQALDDSADTPRYIETLPRRGYRFIYPLNGAVAAGPRTAPLASNRSAHFVLGIGLLLVVALGWIVRDAGGVRRRFSADRTPYRSLAVLPLQNLTGDPEQDSLVAGLHEELITQLAQVKSLKTISRTSVEKYREKPAKTLPQIAKELDVDVILEGSVQRDGDRLRVTIQLLHGPEDRHLWAQAYDREPRQVAPLSGEIVRNVVAALKLKLTTQEQARLGRDQTVNPDAHAAYLRGTYHLNKLTRESVQKGMEYFRQALDIDPAYAPAWHGLANGYQLMARMSETPTSEAESKAKEAVRKALELDDGLWQAHETLGQFLMNYDDDMEGALREFQRAKELNPAWMGHPGFLAHSGRLDEAVAAAEHNVEVDPLNPAENLYLGWTYYLAGRYDESIAQLKRTLELDPTSPHPHYELAWNYVKQGRFPEAVAECEIALRHPGMRPGSGDCGWVYASAGRREEALKIAQAIQSRRGDPKLLAMIYDALGDRERALQYLYQAKAQKLRFVIRLNMTPMWSSELRRDPRFIELLHTVPQQSIRLAQGR